MDHDYQEIWKQCKEELRSGEETREFAPFASKIGYVSSEEGILNLEVSSQFVFDRVKKFIPSIESYVSRYSATEVHVRIGINKSMSPNAGRESARTSTIKSVQDISHTKSREIQREASGVNPDYTFDKFIMGDNSAYAFNASLAIAKNPGRSYNPCLIYGGVGLGKTHLINAIGNYVMAHQPELKVLYITAEAFANEFIASIGMGIEKQQQFKNKFRKVDVLLMDDIQFIQNKTQSQEELFHTFNELYESKKQMVFTCDRPLNELKGVFDRLTSRFERGLNADLQPPAYETRVAILQNKCRLQGKSVGEDIIRYVAENVQSNVRDLEASLTKLISYSELLNVELTLDKARDLLAPMPFMQSKGKEAGLNIQTIIKVVCNYFNVNVSDLKGKKKNKSLAQPRQIAMYLAKQLTNFSFTEIGAEFGNRDHTTVMHACDRISSTCSVDPELKSVIDKMKKEIQASA